MKFLGPNKDGVISGLYSEVKEARPYDFVSLQHLGEITGDIKRPFTQEQAGSSGVCENYTFTEKDGGTELQIEVDTAVHLEKMFNELWPKALAKLKKISE